MDVVGAVVPQAEKPVAAFNAARFALTAGEEGSLPVPGAVGKLLGWSSVAAQSAEIIAAHAANSILGYWKSGLKTRNFHFIYYDLVEETGNPGFTPEDCLIFKSVNEF